LAEDDFLRTLACGPCYISAPTMRILQLKLPKLYAFYNCKYLATDVCLTKCLSDTTYLFVGMKDQVSVGKRAEMILDCFANVFFKKV
jgi:hypothetical protein